MPVLAGLLPIEVVFVCNNRPDSRAVADYYRAARLIPPENMLEVTTDAGETITPDQFVNDIATPLKAFLQLRGSNPDDLASDQIKAIALCYGVPLRINDSSRDCAVDTVLPLLFNTSDWRSEPRQAGFTVMFPGLEPLAYNLAGYAKPVSYLRV